MVALAAMCSLNVCGQLSGYYQEDFEGTFPPAGWQVQNVLDSTYSWMQSTVAHHSGTHSAFIHYSSSDTIQGEDWLILPQFTVAANDSFSFWLAPNFVPYPPDSTVILVSTSDSDILSFTTVLATLSQGDNYPDAPNVFKHYVYSLSGFAGQNIYVGIRNRNLDGDGVFVDLVTIGNPLLNLDAVAISIDMLDYVSTASSLTPKATVKNNSLAEQSFSVTMTITGGYSSTQDVTNLASGALQQVDFDTCLPVAGDDTVSVQAQLLGDEDSTNDTISKVITAFDPISGFYQEDFEGTFPPVAWQVKDVLDKPNTWTQDAGDPYSGTNSAFLLYSYPGVQGEDWLILPQFTVAATDSFSFWLAVPNTNDPPDSTYILISTTDIYLPGFTHVLGVLSEGDNYPATVSTYQYYSFSLADYAGQNIYVAFKNRNIWGDGVYIDLVTIGTPPSLDAMADSIDVPAIVSTTYPILPKAMVKNNSLTEESFSVVMNITGGYSSVKDVTNLSPGATQQIEFDSWQPSDTGAITVSIQTQLAGDIYPENDTLSKVVTSFNPLSGFYQEDFEGSFPPPAWQIRDVLNQPITWLQVPGFSYSGDNSVFLLWSPPGVQGEDWLILPQFTVAATDSFSFWMALGFTGYTPDSTSILISTTDSYFPSFTDTLAILTEGDSYPEVAGTYEYYTYSLAAYAVSSITVMEY